MSRPQVRSRAFGRRCSLAALGLAGLMMSSACVEQEDEDEPSAEDMAIVKQNLLTAAPTPQLPTNADIDGKVVHLGADISPTPIPAGSDVKVTQYWKVVKAPGPGWRMFMHTFGPNNTSFLNWDHNPVKGKYPVGRWKAGDIVRDEHTIRLPPTWPHDKVVIIAGLWKGKDRLPVLSGPKTPENAVLVATVDVARKAPAVVEKKRLLVRRTAKPIKVDGKLDEAAWGEARSTGVFVETLSGGAAAVKTELKALWDKDNLYLAFEAADKDVWARLSKRDDKLWTQEAVEIMIDANGDGKSYVEFQVSPNGAIFDTYLPEYRKYEDSVDQKRRPYDWNSKIKAAVQVDGTLNKREDQDKGWVVEVAIPHADVNGLAKDGAKVPPSVGDTWRANFYRLDGEGRAQTAAAWSPPMVGDFHALDKFGELVFADEQGNAPVAAAAAAKPAGAKPTVEAKAAALTGLDQPGAGDRTKKKTAAKRARAAGEADKK